MLIDVTTDERMDRVSTCGYAFGYIGSCIPFVAGLLLILNCDTIGLPMVTATRISFVITMVWWIIMSIRCTKMCTSNIPCLMSPMFFCYL